MKTDNVRWLSRQTLGKRSGDRIVSKTRTIRPSIFALEPTRTNTVMSVTIIASAVHFDIEKRKKTPLRSRYPSRGFVIIDLLAEMAVLTYFTRLENERFANFNSFTLHLDVCNSQFSVAIGVRSFYMIFCGLNSRDIHYYSC